MARHMTLAEDMLQAVNVHDRADDSSCGGHGCLGALMEMAMVVGELGGDVLNSADNMCSRR